MIIDFKSIDEKIIPHLNNGEGAVSAKMFMDSHNKIMISRLPAGASIGTHKHLKSSEINYVISGSGNAYCDEEKEELAVGICHYCPKGSSHSIVNAGEEDLVLLTIVPEHSV